MVVKLILIVVIFDFTIMKSIFMNIKLNFITIKLHLMVVIFDFMVVKLR